MKYWLRKTVFGLLMSLLLTGSAWAQGRLATIDLQKVFDNYWKTKQAQAVLKERQADMEKELKNMVDDAKKAKDAYDKLVADANDVAIASEERDKRKSAAQEKLKYLKEQDDTITQYRRQATATLDEQTRRMRDNILGEIKVAVEAKAKSSSLALVIDTSADSFKQTPIVLYSNNENDLTQDVLKQLNATAPAGSDTTAKPDNKGESKAEKKDSKKK